MTTFFEIVLSQSLSTRKLPRSGSQHESRVLLPGIEFPLRSIMLKRESIRIRYLS